MGELNINTKRLTRLSVIAALLLGFGMTSAVHVQAADSAAASSAAPVAQLPQPVVTSPTRTPQAILGTDSRVRIPGTTGWPYRTIVFIRAYFPKLARGLYVQGTGTLIAADTVVTAAHVIYDARYGGYASRVEAVPAYSRGTSPYGTARASRLFTAPGYTAHPSSSTDVGAFKLSSPIGKKTGWMSLGRGAAVGQRLTLSGYSADKNGALATMAGPVAKVSGSVGLYGMDSAAGASGSPVYDSSNHIRIVHSFGSASYNGGAIMTPERSNMIMGWRNSWTQLQSMHRLVYVTANNSLNYRNTVFTASSKNRTNTVYQVRKSYLGWNGATYYTVYNARGQYLGYSNVGNFRAVTTTNVTRYMTVRSRTAARYSNLYLSGTKGTTAAYNNRRVYVTTRNVNGTRNRAYYSIYTKKGGSWLGYVSTAAVR